MITIDDLKKRAVWILSIMISACSPPPEQPELRTYGNIIPMCLILCEVHTVESDADPGATSNMNNSSTETGGSKSGGATVNVPPTSG